MLRSLKAASGTNAANGYFSAVSLWDNPEAATSVAQACVHGASVAVPRAASDSIDRLTGSCEFSISAERDVDIIAVATHGRSGLARVVLQRRLK
jgi:hypothetical protein